MHFACPKIGLEDTELLPVMFYVHGGGFTGGYGDWVKDLSRLGEAERPVVLVGINYRLGPLGNYSTYCLYYLFMKTCMHQWMDVV